MQAENVYESYKNRGQDLPVRALKLLNPLPIGECFCAAAPSVSAMEKRECGGEFHRCPIAGTLTIVTSEKWPAYSCRRAVIRAS